MNRLSRSLSRMGTTTRWTRTVAAPTVITLKEGVKIDNKSSENLYSAKDGPQRSEQKDRPSSDKAENNDFKAVESKAPPTIRKNGDAAYKDPGSVGVS
jgi:hypothetical protein